MGKSTAVQPSIFDVDERYVATAASGDLLFRLGELISFGFFQASLMRALRLIGRGGLGCVDGWGCRL